MLRTLQYVEDVDGVLNLGLSHTSAMRCCECVFLATEILEHGYVKCTVGRVTRRPERGLRELARVGSPLRRVVKL